MASRRPARRRTNYRPARRRTYRRRGSDGSIWIILVIAAGVVGWIVQTISRHPVISTAVAILLAGAAAAGVILCRRQRRTQFEIQATRTYTLDAYRRMDAKQFEYALADLCRRDGCTNVRVVGGAGDHAADVIATVPDGRRIVIQAKRFGARTIVGSEDVQKVNGTYKDFHRAHLAAIVTTSRFTKAALADAQHVGIRAYDGTRLAGWASRTGPAPWQ